MSFVTACAGSVGGIEIVWTSKKAGRDYEYHIATILTTHALL